MHMHMHKNKNKQNVRSLQKMILVKNRDANGMP